MEIIKPEENEDPKCPFCEKELTKIVAKQIDKAWFKITEKFIYFCPFCKKVLGVGQSAWMP